MTAGSTKGIALINALIIVAAISAISIGLLSRAEQVIHRLTWIQDSMQTDHYLDGAEILVRVLLDQIDDMSVHKGQAWAQPWHEEPIDRGRVSWSLHDLQGRFNVNRMIGEEDDAQQARKIFLRLAVAQGLPPDRAQLLIEASSSPRLPLRSIEELGLVAGVEASYIARLAEVVAALPREATLNVNTIAPTVVKALWPNVDEVFSAELQARQASEPFRSLDDYLEWKRQFFGNALGDEDPSLRLSVSSEWFEAKLKATSGSVTHSRVLILHRPTADRTSIAYSWTEVHR